METRYMLIFHFTRCNQLLPSHASYIYNGQLKDTWQFPKSPSLAIHLVSLVGQVRRAGIGENSVMQYTGPFVADDGQACRIVASKS